MSRATAATPSTINPLKGGVVVTRTITSEQLLAAHLLEKGIVEVLPAAEAQRLLDDHKDHSASELADFAQRIYARRQEYGIAQFLNDLSRVLGAQLSLIREALVCIYRATVESEPVLCIDGTPDEVPFGDEQQLALLMR